MSQSDFYCGEKDIQIERKKENNKREIKRDTKINIYVESERGRGEERKRERGETVVEEKNRPVLPDCLDWLVEKHIREKLDCSVTLCF